MARIEDCKMLASEGFECVEPCFLFYKDGKRFKTLEGIDGPLIAATFVELKASIK